MTTAIAPTPTSVTPPPRALPVVVAPPAPHRFSVEQYQKMIEAGVLTDDDKVELLEGYLVPKMLHSAPHDGTLDLVKEAFGDNRPKGWCLRSQQSIQLADSQPEPDVSLVRGNSRSFVAVHPTAAEVGVAVEIAVSSLLIDRRQKARIYALAGIVEYWIVNVVDRQIEVHTLPVGDGYTNVQNYTAGQSLPLTLDGIVVATIPFEEMMP